MERIPGAEHLPGDETLPPGATSDGLLGLTAPATAAEAVMFADDITVVRTAIVRVQNYVGTDRISFKD